MEAWRFVLPPAPQSPAPGPLLNTGPGRSTPLTPSWGVEREADGLSEALATERATCGGLRRGPWGPLVPGRWPGSLVPLHLLQHRWSGLPHQTHLVR